jgi:hypothetical protein
MLTSDGAGGTLVTLACFAADTRILPSAGEMPEEALRPGMRVATRRGMRAVRWLGRRRIELASHACPALAAPIRVAAHAMAPGVPQRDLWLSGDHAVLQDGALTPVRFLANGATIAREDRAEISYFHLELDRHDINFARASPPRAIWIRGTARISTMRRGSPRALVLRRGAGESMAARRCSPKGRRSPRRMRGCCAGPRRWAGYAPGIPRCACWRTGGICRHALSATHFRPV